MTRPILITGATGFVGQRLLAALTACEVPVRCGSRRPDRARQRQPEATWVHFDLEDDPRMRAALAGTRAAVYLVHLMADGPGYAQREREAAHRFASAAADAGVERIIYLGGVAPQGAPSPHLQSRLDTGAILRAGTVPTIELRAGMIIGEGSESWKICRDLAVRLPFMLLPRWLKSRSQPVAIDDVVAALQAALELPLPESALFDLPGPEVLSAEEILVRTARLRGLQPRTIALPIITPRLSSYWLKLISGADYMVAKQLVHGLVHDLLPSERSIWEVLPEHPRVSFDDAVRRANAEEQTLSLMARVLERIAQRVSRIPST